VNSERYEERDMEMADSVADKHTDGNRNYDGSNLVYGVKKRVGHSMKCSTLLCLWGQKNKRTHCCVRL